MKQLWCPWRIEYIVGVKPDACPFCLSEDTSDDAKRLVLYRGKSCFVIMNIHPYSNGHLMVVPYRHTGDFCQLSGEETAEAMLLLQGCTDILQSIMAPQGFNIGMNMGVAAGAGIREHAHFHLVPRWNGDSSFMAVLDEVRVIPQHIKSTYMELLPYFKNMEAFRPSAGGNELTA